MICDSQPNFTKGKLCLTSLVAFYDGVTASVDKGRATDVIYLNLCKAFGTDLHHILICKLEIDYSVDKELVKRSQAEGCGSMPRWRPVTSSVPQGSFSGLVLFNIFISDIGDGIKCALSKFADDTELNGTAVTEGSDTIQRELNKLQRWSTVNNIMRFSITK